jgi:GrpB-like predicted nucleotidyltransferase (UPF0157 family)
MMVELKPFGEGSDVTSYQPYDPSLAEVFAEVRTLIRHTLPALHVEHVGSTSIPGVGGRNVIDIAVLAPEESHEAVRDELLGVGFQASPFPHYLPLLVATASAPGHDYPVLVYVVAPDSEVRVGWVAFRDHMRTHPHDARGYDRVKRQAIAAGHTTHEAYQVAKTPYILDLLTRTEQERDSE